MKRFLIGLCLLLCASSAWALSGDGGTVLLVQNGKVLMSGTSGGVPYFSAATTISSSGILTANGVVLGGGAGASPTSTGAGTANQVFRVPVGGAPAAFGQIDLASSAAVVNALPLINGGTNTSSWTASTCVHVNAGGTALVSTAADCATGGTALLGFGSGSDLTAGVANYFSGFGTGIDLTESKVQQIVPGATFKNLRCINGPIAGTANNIIITAMVGACGSQLAGTLTCTLTGAATGNISCSDTTNSATPTVGQCIDFRIATPAALTNNAQVNCTVERTV